MSPDIRIITANTYKNRALDDPESIQCLLPQDEIPTITALQEVHGDTVEEVVRKRGYQARVLDSHGIALAVSPGIEISDVQVVTYPSQYKGRKRGQQILRAMVGSQELIVGNGHMPVFCASDWPWAAYRDAEVFAELAANYPDSLLMSAGDRNYVTPVQRHKYRQLQAGWGAQSLLEKNTPTYALKRGKHRWAGWLRLVADMQLDSIEVRPPAGIELVEGPLLPDTESMGYTGETLRIASDHLAVRALMTFPRQNLSAETTAKIVLQEPRVSDVPDEPGRFERVHYRLQRVAHDFLYVDQWLMSRDRFERLPRTVQGLTRTFIGGVWGTIRNMAGGVRGDYLPR